MREGEWGVLQFDRRLTQGIARLDERAADVPVFAECLCEWLPGLLRESNGRRDGRIGHSGDNVGICKSGQTRVVMLASANTGALQWSHDQFQQPHTQSNFIGHRSS